MSNTYPVQASTLRIGNHVMIQGHPCKITRMSTSKTGKHGHAKIHIVGIDIFDGSKHDLLSTSTHNVDVPVVNKVDYQLTDIDEDKFMILMNDSGEIKEDIKLPPNEELAKKIQTHYDDGKELMISIISAIDKEQAIAWKECRD